MRLPYKLVIPTLLILSLFGFVEGDANSGLKLRYHKETEWVKETCTFEEDATCYFCSFYLNVVTVSFHVAPCYDAYLSNINKQIRVALITQKRSCRKRDPAHILLNSPFTPRKSIAHHSIS